MNKIKTISFDYGNTLVEFGPKQVEYMFSALSQTLTDILGPCDTALLKEIRDRQILAPYSNSFKEDTLAETSWELVYELYGVKPDRKQLKTIINTRYESFVDSIELSNGTINTLEKLKKNYSIGLISNYPCSRSIISSLEKIGLKDFFDIIVVSGDLGYVKPHPLPFETLLTHFKITGDQCLHVGDNWLADIQGAKRLAIKSALVTGFTPYERFEPCDGDMEPDFTIADLNELVEILFKS